MVRLPASTPIELLPVVPRATVPVQVLAPATFRSAPALLTPSPFKVRLSAAKVVPVPPSARVPLAFTMVPAEVEPRALAFSIWRVPPNTVVLPVYVFTLPPVRMVVPESRFSSEPAPLIAPERTVVPVPLSPRMFPPVSMLPVIVKVGEMLLLMSRFWFIWTSRPMVCAELPFTSLVRLIVVSPPAVAASKISFRASEVVSV